jgi:putative membrane protein
MGWICTQRHARLATFIEVQGAHVRILSTLLVVIVALLHIGFMGLEMFLWTMPLGQRLLSMTPEVSAVTAVLAANQGLYNGFIAAGLLWSAISGRRDLKIFFLVCVVMAGIFGAMTAKLSILFLQAMPGAIALAFVLATKDRTQG